MKRMTGAYCKRNMTNKTNKCNHCEYIILQIVLIHEEYTQWLTGSISLGCATDVSVHFCKPIFKNAHEEATRWFLNGQWANQEEGWGCIAMNFLLSCWNSIWEMNKNFRNFHLAD